MWWPFHYILLTVLLEYLDHASHHKNYKWCRALQLMTTCSSIIVYKDYVSFSARFNLLYIAVCIKNCTSVIKVASMKKCRWLRILLCKGSHHVLPPNRHFSLSAKMNEAQRRTLVSPWRMHCSCCGMPKGTSRTEATSNREIIEAVLLAIVELC